MTPKIQAFVAQYLLDQKTGVSFTPEDVPLFHGCCVYVHRRLTDGSVFYVGLGSRNRSKAVTSRSSVWKDTVAQHGRSVQIVEVYDSPLVAQVAEIELIRALSEAGVPLVNRTAGGEGGPRNRYETADQARDALKGLIIRVEKERMLRQAIKTWQEKKLAPYLANLPPTIEPSKVRKFQEPRVKEAYDSAALAASLERLAQSRLKALRLRRKKAHPLEKTASCF